MSGKVENRLFKNTILLYILTFSDYFFGFITVPYLTRVLGAEVYGVVGVGQAVAVYVQLFLDFGFILSATADIALVRDNRERVNQVFSAVFFCKSILVALSLAVMLFLTRNVGFFREYATLYMLFWLYMAINSFIPDFLYRGMEKMGAITIRSVILKGVFAVCIFIFVKEKGQYLLVPVFYALGAFFAVVFMYIDAIFKLKLRVVPTKLSVIFGTFKRSSGFFLSRIATTVYSSLNMLVLGNHFGGQPIMGCYTASDRLLSAGRAVMSPVADSLYPYMVKEKNVRLARKIILVGESVVIAGCIGVFIIARPLCILFFGPEYADAAGILRMMLVSISLTLPTYILGFPMLTPLGMQKYANMSNIIGACVQGVELILLGSLKMINVYSVCTATIITEIVVLIMRIWAT